MGRVIAEYGPSGQNPQGGLVLERIYRGGQIITTDEAVGTCRRTAAQFVREFYWGALNRQPNPQELGQWSALIGSSFGQARLNNAKALGDTIFTSTEYLNRQRTDEEYVADLYWTYLQRPADVDGLKFWVGRIALQGRDGVREGFELSNEFAAHVADICAPGEPRGEVLWVMQDHQGSTRAMLNSAGQVVGRHDALPFGDTTGEANEVGPQAPEDETTGLHGWWNTIRQRYAGLERDAATGLEHATFRKYEPWAGRWTSPDPYLGSMNPADPQSFNRYSYVQNDPVNFVDPTGLLRIQQCTVDWISVGGERIYGAPRNCETIYDDSGGGGGGGGGPQEPSKPGFEKPTDRRTECQRFADMVRDIANSASSRRGFLDALASTFTAANNSSIGEMRRTQNMGLPRGRPSFGADGFQEQFRDPSNQVRHFVGGFIAGASIGWIPARTLMNSREQSGVDDADIALNGVSTYLGATTIGNGIRYIRNNIANEIRRQLCQ